MENNTLKNQKLLNETLPNAQLGSKYTKLTNRFACKSNYPLSVKLPSQHHSISQSSFLNLPHQNLKNKNPSHNRGQSSLQPSQLEYFKQVNTQIKQENQNLKQDLKICQQKINKIMEEKKRTQQKLMTYQKTMNRSQKKISSLMGLAHHLIVMVKDKFFVSEQGSNAYFESTSNGKSVKSFVSPFESKRLDMQKQLQRIQEFTRCKRINCQKKKTIETMMEQHQAEMQQNRFQKPIKKSTFYERKSYKFCDETEQQKSYSDLKSEQHMQEEEQTTQLMNSLQNFEKDAKQLNLLQQLIQGIAKTFNEETQTESPFSSSKDNMSNINARNYVLEQIGIFFNSLISEQQENSQCCLKFDSKVINEKIKPNYASHRLYGSIKEIFDHQIYLLQNQKMQFLQYKNKRLLKFIYECSGCQRYEEMFSEVFRILREGFKEIKFKIVPELKNKHNDDIEILL